MDGSGFCGVVGTKVLGSCDNVDFHSAQPDPILLNAYRAYSTICSTGLELG